MPNAFYGVIQSVGEEGDRLVIRCVREFFHGNGLMADDVWIWEVAGAEAGMAVKMQTLIGRTVDYFRIEAGTPGQALRISFEEGEENLVVAGRSVAKREEGRSAAELRDVVAQLVQRINRNEGEYAAFDRRLKAAEDFVVQRIGRLQRRAAAARHPGGPVAKSLAAEIEDLQTILARLNEPTTSSGPGPAV